MIPERTSRPPTAPPAHATIVHAMRRHAEQRGGAAAFELLHGRAAASLRQLNFARVDRLASAVAGALRAPGEGAGPVVLLFEPGLEFVVAFLGCLVAGRPAVPARPPRSVDELAALERITDIAGAERILVDADSRARLAEAGAGARLLQRARSLDWLRDDAAVDDNARRSGGRLPRAESTAFLQFTSGSTRAPKAVVVTHGNLADNQRVIAAAFEHDDQTDVVGWLPHYHDMGLIGNVLQPLFLGRPCRLMSPVAFLQRPMRWLRAIAGRTCVTSGGPNFAFQHCVSAISARELARGPRLDLSGWRVAFVGAEPVRAATMAAFAARFAEFGFDRDALYPCYGLAEATLMLTGGRRGAGVRSLALDRAALDAGFARSADRDDASHVVACGFPRGANRVRIVDPKTRRSLPDDRIGEIWARGPSIAGGYFGESASARRFGARLHGAPGRRYLRTGDLGFIREGELFVTGRLESLILLHGRKLYPQDLEECVQRLHPAFRAGGAAAFTVATATGVRLVVAQEVRGPAVAGLDPRRVLRAARAALAAGFGARLDDLVLTTDSLARTGSGKLRHHEIRRRYLDDELRRVVAPHVGEGRT